MNRTMGDGVTLANIPETVDIAAVYVNGDYAADPAAVARRFPPARKVIVWIDVNGTAPLRAQVLDVEQLDAPVSRAPGWVRTRRAAVHSSLPTLYCNRSTYPTLLTVCRAAGLIAARDYQWWISTLDGTEEMNGVPLDQVPGVVACQARGGMTAAYDESLVYDPKWHPLAA